MCVLLTVPAGASAQADATNEKCHISDFAIMGKDNGMDFLYKMGENLKIRVTGGCVAVVKKVSRSNLVLHLMMWK